jgi:hypothetical protein
VRLIASRRIVGKPNLGITSGLPVNRQEFRAVVLSVIALFSPIETRTLTSRTVPA